MPIKYNYTSSWNCTINVPVSFEPEEMKQLVEESLASEDGQFDVEQFGIDGATKNAIHRVVRDRAWESCQTESWLALDDCYYSEAQPLES